MNLPTINSGLRDNHTRGSVADFLRTKIQVARSYRSFPPISPFTLTRHSRRSWTKSTTLTSSSGNPRSSTDSIRARLKKKPLSSTPQASNFPTNFSKNESQRSARIGSSSRWTLNPSNKPIFSMEKCIISPMPVWRRPSLAVPISRSEA